MGRKAKTRKERTQSQRPAKKAKYRVTNWAEYNASLVRRGSVELWISQEVLEAWQPKPDGPRPRGGQLRYSTQAIECLLTLRAVYSLPLRATEGLGQSLLKLLGVTLPVPDYTTLSKRGKELAVTLPRRRSSEPLVLVVDSTGLKIFGEGEWKVRQHGFSKRRVWRKLHLGVNALTQDVEAVLLTGAGSDDGEAGSAMLQTIEPPVQRVTGDGAYDKRTFYDTCQERHIPEVIVPPRRSARIWQHGNSAKPRLPRDEHLRFIRRHGRKRWKQQVGYHRRSLAETAVFRFKTLFGGQLAARAWAGQVTEVRIKCRALNRMTQLGMPHSVRVA